MTIMAYHFVGDTLRDGRPVPPDGEWLTHDGPIVMCESGLYASRDPFDALMNGRGGILCLVECEDIVEELCDKLVCRRRRIIKRIRATKLLLEAARKFALTVIDLWDASLVVREYLETGDESKRLDAHVAALDVAAVTAIDPKWRAADVTAWHAARAVMFATMRITAGECGRELALAAACAANTAAKRVGPSSESWARLQAILRELVSAAFAA